MPAGGHLVAKVNGKWGGKRDSAEAPHAFSGNIIIDPSCGPNRDLRRLVGRSIYDRIAVTRGNAVSGVATL